LAQEKVENYRAPELRGDAHRSVEIAAQRQDELTGDRRRAAVEVGMHVVALSAAMSQDILGVAVSSAVRLRLLADLLSLSIEEGRAPVGRVSISSKNVALLKMCSNWWDLQPVLDARLKEGNISP
jgi:hypothetical protein